jgi:hypothetical protein
MIRIAPLLTIIVVGCGPSDRDLDCAEVHKILAEAAENMPRLKRDGSWTPRLRDEQPMQLLRDKKYRDPEIGDAVRAMVDETGWQFYTPYAADGQPPRATARVAELCELPPALALPD